MITENDYSNEQEKYFDNLIKSIDDTAIVISMSYYANRENFIHLNTCYDPYALLRLINILKNYDLPIKLFVPKCLRNTLSEIIYLSNVLEIKIFLGECIPTSINPTLKKTLKEIFEIYPLTKVQKDLQIALDD